MARPRHDEKGPSAVERIENAFWDMLSRMPYREIKIAALAREASVSPNTLYYHYANLEAIARHALRNCLDKNVVNAVLEGGSAPIPEFDRTQQARVAAFARSGSATLTGMLADSLRDEWLTAVGISANQLSETQQQDIAFIFGGVVSALGNGSLSLGAREMGGFLSRPLGQGVVATMTALASVPQTATDADAPDRHRRRAGHPDTR